MNASWYGVFPSGYALIQEFETSFGTNNEAMSRFLKSVDLASNFVSTTNEDSAGACSTLFRKLNCEDRYLGENIYPALKYIYNRFSPVRNMKTACENVT